jgi:predicted KAP-like P-loop ATPase
MESTNKNIHSKVKQIRFLSDQPLSADRKQEMRFGHPSIVENLKTLVLSCPTPFTIGLFGKWGTGKTTILDALKCEFHATEIAAIKIDAWKHEGDALRRTFLQDTINQLQEKQGKKQYLGTGVKLSET